jgi:hypothetical protein
LAQVEAALVLETVPLPQPYTVSPSMMYSATNRVDDGHCSLGRQKPNGNLRWGYEHLGQNSLAKSFPGHHKNKSLQIALDQLCLRMLCLNQQDEVGPLEAQVLELRYKMSYIGSAFKSFYPKISAVPLINSSRIVISNIIRNPVEIFQFDAWMIAKISRPRISESMPETPGIKTSICVATDWKGRTHMLTMVLYPMNNVERHVANLP